MDYRSIIVMILSITIVWGGFIFLLFKALRNNKMKNG
ncbi:MAG: MetS family NSS transporter small subunit [Ignavibacteria bacterium]|nr:MetS family NSS transporter small subunit [Ignavibacteria bacterium]